MVRCKECGVVIGCRTEVCPLCGARLRLNAEQVRSLPRAFPPRGKAPIFSNAFFDKVYWLIAFAVLLTAYLSEGLSTGRLRVSAALSGFFFYIYFSIRSTFQDSSYFAQKVEWQALALSALLLSLWGVLPNPKIILEWVLPAIYVLAMAIVGIYILLRFHKSRKSALQFLKICVMGYFPVVGLALAGGGNYWAGGASAAIGTILFVLALGFSRKNILAELKRSFHL